MYKFNQIINQKKLIYLHLFNNILESSESCFPSMAKVKVESGKSVKMYELQIGDRVQTSMFHILTWYPSGCTDEFSFHSEKRFLKNVLLDKVGQL